MQCRIEVAKQSLSTQCKPLHSCAQKRTLHRGRRFGLPLSMDATVVCVSDIETRMPAWHQRPTSTRLCKTDFASVRRVRRGGGSSGVVADVRVGSVVSGVRLQQLSDICSHDCACVHDAVLHNTQKLHSGVLTVDVLFSALHQTSVVLLLLFLPWSTDRQRVF